MKKFKMRAFSALLAIFMIMTMLPTAFAVSGSDLKATAFLSVSNQGMLAADNNGAVMAGREVIVTDINGDGILTYDEALIAAHKMYNSEDGYLAPNGYVSKLWGVETTNALFFINNHGLTTGVAADTISDGDMLVASINKDNIYYSDWYSFFDVTEKNVAVGEEFSLILKGHLGMAFTDEDKTDIALNDISVGLWDNNAFSATEDWETDKDGKVTISFAKEGKYCITAQGVAKTIVTDYNLTNMSTPDNPVFGVMDFETYETQMAYTETDYGDGPYPVAEVKYVDFEEWKNNQENYHTLRSNQLITDCPIIAPYCEVTVTKTVDSDTNITAAWPSFRGNSENMGVVDATTPKDVSHTELKWAKILGTGWASSPSAQIIVDDSLVTMCGNEIYKLSLIDGEVLASGQMSSKPNWGYAPPTYADGMIFCPLSGGVIEAFSAKTLEKVWTFDSENANNNQALSPITYADGKIYTGYWRGDASPADFLCVNASTGELEWSYEVNGGFYWAGSVSVGDFIVVGTDDGETGNSNLLVFKKDYTDGEEVRPVASAELTGCGDQRSSLAYSDGKVYFTTRGGFLGSAAIDAKTGAISSLKTVSFSNDDGNRESTSTPVVYGDYVYFGVGKGYGNGWFVIADRDTLEVVKELKMISYPQCSLLLSTAYLEEDGKLYLYSTYNGTPGGISLVTVEPNNPESAVLSELYDAEGYKQFCICSPICDENGTIYYKNDSEYILAVGRKVVPEITVSAYDYNAVAAGIDGASENGLIFSQTIPYIDGLTAVDAVNKASEMSGVEIVMNDGYVSSINGLGAGEGMSGWCLNYNNDDFANMGLQSLTLEDGDNISFHYSVNPDGQTDDVGNGWYGKPIITSITLANRTVTLRKETTFNETGSVTKYFIRGAQGGEKELSGSGTETDPFLIPITLPQNADLGALKAEYQTSLGEHYRKVTGLDGNQDYISDHAVTIATLGGNTTFYIIKADLENIGGGTTEDKISVYFRLIGATKSTEDVDFETGTGDSKYQNWIKTKTYQLDKNATAYDLFTKALDDAGLSYKGVENKYVKSITAPDVYGAYELSEFTNGPRAGWMYMLNGKHSNLGLCEQKLRDGDVMVLHYVNDYGYEVKDWYDDPNNSGEGNEDTWVDWDNDIPDTNPSSSGGNNGGNNSGGGGGGSSAANGYYVTFNTNGGTSLPGVKVNRNDVLTKPADPTREGYIFEGWFTDAQCTQEYDFSSKVTKSFTLYAKWKESSANTGDWENPFADVKEDDWYFEAVKYASQNKLFNGTDDVTFAPYDVMNRAMLVTVLYRTEGEPEAEENDFIDVPKTEYYADAVSWASTNGIVSGYDKNTFAPDDALTREQIAVIMSRYAQLKGVTENNSGDLSKFTDSAQISQWARSAVEWAVGYGLISGRDNSTIAPKGSATRAEVAEILMRFLNNNAQ